MNHFGKKKNELDLLSADEVVQSPSQKFIPFVLAGLVIIVVLGIYLVVFLANLFAQGGLNTAKADVASKTAQWQHYKQTATDIKGIQSTFTQYKTFVTTYSSLDKKIQKLQSVLPQGVHLTNLTIDNVGTTVISGGSAIPEDAYQFRDVLQADKEISGVTLTTVAKTGLGYTFTLNFVITTK